MFYVVEMTSIGPIIKECFRNEELAMSYVNALHANDARKRYRVLKTIYDTTNC